MKIMKVIDSYLYDQIDDNCYVKYECRGDHQPECEWVYVVFSADLLRLQDVLDEVPNADPYEKIEYIHKNEFDHIIIGYRNSLGWPCAITINPQ